MVDPQPHDARALERRTVGYSGHVQGVGFRYRTREIASRYRVTGYVRNLPDGRVELVAEGAPQELDRFLADLAGSLEVHIRRIEVDRCAASGEFDEFDIRR